MKRMRKNRKGAAAVEFALIAIILFTIVFGIIEFGLLLYNKSMLTHASRVAARTGAMYAYSNNGTVTDLTDDKTHQDDAAIIQAAETFWKDRFITFGNRATAFKAPVIQRLSWDSGTGSFTPVTYGNEKKDDLLEVTLQYEYNFLLLSRALGIGPITLTAKTTMRFE